MRTQIIEYPVFTFDQQELLPAGTRLSLEILAEVSRRNKYVEKVHPLFTYASVKKDLLYLMSQPPYNIIFSDQKMTNVVLKQMDQVQLPLPLLEIIYYFYRVDFYTYRHFLMVYALSTLLSEQLLSDQKEKLNEAIAGPVHDIGKLCVPSAVLTKESPLTTAERAALEHHATAGYVLLSYYFQDTQHFAAIIARDHHERKDGSGYPTGINIKNSTTDIIMVSDIYDALISPRPYRLDAFENRTALEEITAQAISGKISLEVVKALIAVNRTGKPHYSECFPSEERRGREPEHNLYGIIQDAD